MLRGLTPKFGSFDDAQFDELRIEHHLSSNPALATAACRSWIRNLQARFIAGDYATAIDAASKAQRLLWASTAFFEEAEYHFYGALSRAASCNSAPAGERQQHLDALVAHHRQTAGLGGELSGEFREPRRPGRRGDCPDRRPK